MNARVPGFHTNAGPSGGSSHHPPRLAAPFRGSMDAAGECDRSRGFTPALCKPPSACPRPRPLTTRPLPHAAVLPPTQLVRVTFHVVHLLVIFSSACAFPSLPLPHARPLTTRPLPPHSATFLSPGAARACYLSCGLGCPSSLLLCRSPPAPCRCPMPRFFPGLVAFHVVIFLQVVPLRRCSTPVLSPPTPLSPPHLSPTQLVSVIVHAA